MLKYKKITLNEIMRGETPQPIPKQEKKMPPPLPPEARKERKAGPPPAPGSAERAAFEKKKADEESIKNVKKDIGVYEADMDFEHTEEKENSLNTFGESFGSAKHEKNEDAFAVGENFVLVTDGMGGYTGGFEASHTIAETVKDHEKQINAAVASADQKQIEDVLKRVVEASQNAVATTAAMRAGTKNIGATFTMGVHWKIPEKKGTMGFGRKPAENKITIAQVGDSSIGLLRDKLYDMTREQSVLQFLIEQGIFPDDQSLETEYTLDELKERVADKFPENVVQELNPVLEAFLRPRDNALVESGHFKIVDGNKVGLLNIKNIREVTTSAMTTNPNQMRELEIKTLNVMPGDKVIYSSDGLGDNLLKTETQAIATKWKNDPETLNEMLVKAAKIRMGEMKISDVPELTGMLEDSKDALGRAKQDDVTVVTREIR